MSPLRTVIHSYKGFGVLFTAKQKFRTRIIGIVSTLIAFADIVGLSSMVPVLMLAIDHSFLEKSSKLRAIYQYFHFQTEASFLKVLILFILLFFFLKSFAAIWLYKFVRKTAIDISKHLSIKSYAYAFKHNSYEKVAADGLGFNDMVLFTPYFYISGVFLPFLNIISEVAVVFMLVLVFTIYKPVLFFLLVGLLGTAFFIVNRYTRSRITKLGEAWNKNRDDCLKELNLGISGFTDIKAHGVEAFFQRRFMKHYSDYATNGIKAVSYQLIPARINEFVALLGIVILVVYGYFYSGENLATVRVLAALFAISVFRLIPAANRLLQALMHLKLYHYTTDKLVQVVSQEAEAPNTKYDFSSELKLSKLSFSYEGASSPVLEEVDLVIKKGEIVGISGPSGAGKTTLAKILLGFHVPTHGGVFLDQQKVESTENIQSLFGYMGQEPFVLNASIRENIALGIAPEVVDENRVQKCISDAALKVGDAANVADIEVGENGAMLSEGQKQRLVLARELYRDAPIIILDEPTSALDSETEEEVILTLKELGRRGKTMIIIAHRERIFDLCTSIYSLEERKLKKIK
ncbi:MAG: ATP-binding cassette domain-containing protein [Bacteroidia bacterium]|nr:ATP-binding cassette domain-containing protein [Bacteroidia bacterium]